MDFIRQFYGEHALIAALFLLIILDVLSGIAAAAQRHSLASSISYQGMLKKTSILFIVAVAIILDPFVEGPPLQDMVTIFYIFTESLSILENADNLGIKVPDFLLKYLKQASDKANPPPEPPPTPVAVVAATVTVPVMHVDNPEQESNTTNNDNSADNQPPVA